MTVRWPLPYSTPHQEKEAVLAALAAHKGEVTEATRRPGQGADVLNRRALELASDSLGPVGRDQALCASQDQVSPFRGEGPHRESPTSRGR